MGRRYILIVPVRSCAVESGHASCASQSLSSDQGLVLFCWIIARLVLAWILPLEENSCIGLPSRIPCCQGIELVLQGELLPCMRRQ